MIDKWEGIYGQEHVKKLLDKLIISGKIPHALLFSGTNGVGKYYTAIRFSQILNNLENNLTAVKSIGALSEPYLKFIFPLPRGKNETENSSPLEKLSSDEIQNIQEQLQLKINNPYYKIALPKANFIKISSIRDIKKFLTFNYNDLSFRIIIISDAHLMNEESQNALLKSLEEPPEKIIFILITPLPMILKETIRSRCWQVNFQPLDNNSVKNILVKYFSIDINTAEIVSNFSNGSVDLALKLKETNLDDLLSRTISVMRYSFGKKFNSAFTELNLIIDDNNQELFRLFIQLILTWLNDVLKYRTGIRDISFHKHIDTIEKFNVKFPSADLIKAANRLEYFVSLLKNNVNLNIISLNTIYILQDLVTAK